MARRGFGAGLALACALIVSPLLARPASAQIDGSVSVMVDALPHVDPQSDTRVSELRTRLFLERKQDVGPHLRLELSGYADGLYAHRLAGTTREAIVRPLDLYAELHSSRFELRVGNSRVVWGRLDEFQPTDVVNAIDLERFLLEGRTEARLPSALARVRVHLTSSTTLEALVVPLFRPSTFDQLDQPTSPFNLAADARIAIPVVRTEPVTNRKNVQGGGRLTSSIGRFDWGVSAFRGFRTFPVANLRADPALVPVDGPSPPAALDAEAVPLTLLESFPRFTMVGGDFETVSGPWGVRGELAASVDDELQATTALRSVPGRRLEAGIGVDRRAGNYRIAGNVLWSKARVDAPFRPLVQGDDALSGDDWTLVVAADRSFARETRTLRLFAVVDPVDRTTFVRSIAAFSLHDNVWLEASGGVFAGSSSDIWGRLTRRDFACLRFKAFF